MSRSSTDIIVVDATQRETSNGAYVPVAILPGSEQVILATVDSKLPIASLDSVLRLAVQGCHQVHFDR